MNWRVTRFLRPIPSSIRPIPCSNDLTVDEYDNEWNDELHEWWTRLIFKWFQTFSAIFNSSFMWPTDRASYRGAMAHLKRKSEGRRKWDEKKESQKMNWSPVTRGDGVSDSCCQSPIQLSDSPTVRQLNYVRDIILPSRIVLFTPQIMSPWFDLMGHHLKLWLMTYDSFYP